MDNNRVIILNKAAEVFLRYGIRSVSMDDLCRELGMSKKTLYQYFETKDDLIYRVLEQHCCEEMGNIRRLRDVARDAIEEFLLIGQMNVETIRQASPRLMYDLQKYHAEVWNRMLCTEAKLHLEMLTANLEWGISQGLYRAEIPIDIVARLFFAQSTGMLEERLFPADFERLEQALVTRDNLFLRGIATAQGVERLLDYREQGIQEVSYEFMGRTTRSPGRSNAGTALS